jgi:predicted O-methyltransferase YrrM
VTNPTPTVEIAGQLNAAERRILTSAVLDPATKPKVVLEVGTWLGGGSTLHLLRALEQNREGHLWGIEADPSIYDQMQANIRRAAPEAIHRFTPLFGFSHEVIPRWLRQLGTEPRVDIVFLDGGNNPGEQIEEFQLLNPHIPIGGLVMAHDAKMRKGKWLVPYLSLLGNWKVQLHDVSEYGLMQATKIAPQPSKTSRRAAEIALLKMRCNPIEIAAAILPAKVCGFALRLLPTRIARRLSEGCR